MGVLEVKNLNKTFGKFVAVNNISFSLKEGEILGLLGPNGAGKTTTIQMLLAVLTPTSGTINYFGKDINKNREEILEKVNFSTTYTNLPWNLTVREALTYTSFLYDLSDRKKSVQGIVEKFRLEELLNLRIAHLSAGQLTRVNLAKAFINNPQVLLLDEPTASLDPDVARFIRDFILSQQETEKLSIIFTSHNMTEVEEVCDRVLFINNGKIVANDTPQNLTRTIETCKVTLVIDKKNEKKLFDYCRKTNKKVSVENREYTIELKEKEITELLSSLNNENIHFYEITIDKPDLEDYFLLIAKDNQNKEL